MKKINLKKFALAAKKEGLEHFQLTQKEGSSLKITLFAGEVEKYTASKSGSLFALGMYEGKLGSFSTEKFGPGDYEHIAHAIHEDAKYKSEEAFVGLYEGAPKYKKKKLPSSDLASHSPEEKIALLKAFHEKITKADSRIAPTISIMYAESSAESLMVNDRDLKLAEKDSFAYIVSQISTTDGAYTKTSFVFHLARNLEEFDLDALTKELVDSLFSQLGAKSIPSGSYPTVIKNSVLASLVPYLADAASAEEVEKKTTYLLDKLNQKVVSNKITLSEKPLETTSEYHYFDDEGVPAQTKDIIKKGVLTTYLHNRETAKKFGVTSTGNASYGGGKFRVASSSLYLKGSKTSFEDMIAPIKKGVYITDIQGLGTGLNPTTGDFSCQANGYLIEDGKVSSPITLITLGGNLLKMFSDTKALSNRLSKDGEGAIVPDIYIKKMQIGGQ